MCKAFCLFYEDRSKEIKLWFLFKRDLNLKGRVKQKGEQEKERDDTHKYKTHRDPAAAAKFLQLCPTLRPHGQQPTRLPVHGIPQARILEWVAISLSI